MNAPPNIRAENFRERGIDLLGNLISNGKSDRAPRDRKPAHTILNRFNIDVKHFLESGRERRGYTNFRDTVRQFLRNVSRGEVARRHSAQPHRWLLPQEQPVKSSSAAVVVAPAVTFRGIAVGVVESLLVV